MLSKIFLFLLLSAQSQTDYFYNLNYFDVIFIYFLEVDAFASID